MNIKDECIAIAAENLPKNSAINPTNQIEHIFSHAATNKDFGKIIVSEDARVRAELKAQIKYICSLDLDAAKGKKLIYVKTRNVNVGDQNRKIYLMMPDISESYHALILILTRSGILDNITVQHTYSGYQIDYTGVISDVPVVRSWESKPTDRGEYTGCFVTLYLPNNVIQTSYHHSADINATHKAFSRSNSTWKSHELAMTAKSAIMDALRYIPKIDGVVSEMVEHYDNSHDFEESENTISNEKISDDDIAWIKNSITEKGMSLEDFVLFLNKNRVNQFEDITESLFVEIKQMINDYKQKEIDDVA